jgi:hypothetical protein
MSSRGEVYLVKDFSKGFNYRRAEGRRIIGRLFNQQYRSQLRLDPKPLEAKDSPC